MSNLLDLLVKGGPVMIPGIGGALITTAGGMIVAIIALVIFRVCVTPDKASGVLLESGWQPGVDLPPSVARTNAIRR